MGSFVWTHLTNLQETSNPSKQQIRQMLSSETLRAKFSTDARKFSRNVEVSTFSDEWNAGGTAEANVVFSPESYLPRSATLNLTVDLFGESVNLLEVGARVQGFEPLVESVFGPSGLFPDQSIEKMLRSMRSARSVRDADDDGDNSLDALSAAYDVGGRSAGQPQGHVYLRVFGNELHADRLRGLNGADRPSGFLGALMRTLGDQDVDYTKSVVFLDASYVVPTAVGLPLNLTVNGTATVDVRVGGRFHFGGLDDVEVRGHVQPSAAVVVNGAMSVDAFVGRSGVRIRNAVHSAGGVQGHVVIKGRQLVSVQLGAPQKRVDLFSMDSDLFLIHKDRARAVEPTTAAVERRSCTPSSWNRYLGVELCGRMALHPASADGPSGPLRGPARLALYLQKTDSHDQYLFEYEWSGAGRPLRSFSLSLDTPRSQVDRRVATHLTLDASTKSLQASLVSPLTRVELSGNYEYSRRRRSVDAALTVDGTRVVSVRAGLRADRENGTGRYEADLVVARGGRDLVDFRGHYDSVDGSKYKVDAQLQHLTARPIQFTSRSISLSLSLSLSTTLFLTLLRRSR